MIHLPHTIVLPSGKKVLLLEFTPTSRVDVSAQIRLVGLMGPAESVSLAEAWDFFPPDSTDFHALVDAVTAIANHEAESIAANEKEESDYAQRHR